MKQLLIITPTAYLRGGVETIVHDLARELPRHGWSVTLGLAAGPRFHDPERYLAAWPGAEGVPIRPRYLTRRSRVAAIMAAVDQFKPDVVLAARIADAYEAVSRLKREGRGPRLAVAIRGFEAQYIYDAAAWRGFIDAVCVDGRLIEQACVELAGLDPNRVCNLPGGVQPPLHPPQPRKVGEVLRIGYVGRLAQADKRVLDLIGFVERLEQAGLPFQLTVAGDGPEGPSLQAALATAIVAGRVRLLGWQSHMALYREVLPNLDCQLNFSPTEGVTIAPREGLVHGVVQVLSRFPGLEAEGVFRHAFNALTFEVGDLDAAARHVMDLYQNPHLLTRLSTAAIGAQGDRYMSDGSIAAWAQCLDQCLTAPPMRSATLPTDQYGPRLERIGVPGALSDWMRASAGRIPAPREPGDEWPHAYARTPVDAQSQLLAFARQCDAKTGSTLPGRTRASTANDNAGP